MAEYTLYLQDAITNGVRNAVLVEYDDNNTITAELEVTITAAE